MASESEPDSAAFSASAEEWSIRAADTVESALDVVHDKVVRPALVAGRAVVFGVVIAVVTLVVFVFLAIALVRLLDVYAFSGRVWASDALIGTLACAGGFAIWTLRRRKRASED